MILLTLKTLPLSVNATYKRGRNSFYKSKEAKDAQQAMMWEAKAQYRGKPLEKSLNVHIAFFWSDNRRRDIDNPIKALCDAMTGILWLDDSQIFQMTVSKATDKENARIEMEVGEIT